MTNPRNISISDYTYQLPDNKIALHPLPERDASKLLIYKNKKLQEDVYRNIAAYIPEESLLVFNNSKVINARIKFKKDTGGTIEIFCLEPHKQLHEFSSIMNKAGKVTWKCFVGGAGKWKEKELVKKITVNNEETILKAILVEKLTDAYAIEFSWLPAHFSFAEIIETAGNIPLPPYIKRETEEADTGRYQTIYAMHDGSVAAPTAGLHFTENVFNTLSKKNIESTYVTLHVGAGTFKPVKASTMQDHEMHAEWIDVHVETIRKILEKKDNVIAVGTTSLRTIESLYWLGVKSHVNPAAVNLDLKQWDVYEAPLQDILLPVDDALQSLINWMEAKNRSRIFTQTQLLITPGYQFKITKALVTNFHQPQSTLLLLVAAAVGNDWKMIYNHALNNEYRFLSYGDGNLIFINTLSNT